MKESEQGREGESRRNFVHKIASRQSAEGISYTKLLPDNPRTEFCTRNYFPTIRGGNFAHEITSRQPAEGILHTKFPPDAFCDLMIDHAHGEFACKRDGNVYQIAAGVVGHADGCCKMNALRVDMQECHIAENTLP